MATIAAAIRPLRLDDAADGAGSFGKSAAPAAFCGDAAAGTPTGLATEPGWTALISPGGFTGIIGLVGLTGINGFNGIWRFGVTPTTAFFDAFTESFSDSFSDSIAEPSGNLLTSVSTGIFWAAFCGVSLELVGASEAMGRARTIVASSPANTGTSGASRRVGAGWRIDAGGLAAPSAASSTCRALSTSINVS